MTKADIAEVLKRIRIDSGMTQKQAAEKIGRKQQTLASWETGQSQPDADTLFVLCEMYGTTVNDAFGFNDERHEVNKDEHAHIKKYRLLTPKSQNAVNTLIDTLLDAEQYRQAPIVTYGQAAAFGWQTHTSRLTEENSKKANEALSRLRQKNKE